MEHGTGPTGIDISDSGEVYVANHFNHVIDVFSATGTHLRTFGSGKLIFPQGIAVAADGTVFSSGSLSSNTGVVAFDSSGSFIRNIASSVNNFGVAVDDAGLLYISDIANGRIVVYQDNNTYVRQYGQAELTSPHSVTLNSLGDTYVCDGTAVFKFDSAGSLKATLSNAAQAASETAISPTGELYLADRVGNVVKRWFDSEAWVSGQNHFAQAAVGSGQLLGQSQTLSAGKSLIVDGNATVMSGGILELRGGEFTVGNIIVKANGKLAMEIGEDALENALINCMILAQFGGTLEVTLADGYAPRLGDTFKLFDAPTFGGEFDDMIIPVLSDGMSFDASSLSTDGTLSVVPEPGTITLMVMAASGLWVIRKRRLAER